MQKIILSIFEKHREAPKTAHKKKDFLENLIQKPNKSFRHSYSGMQRYKQLMRTLEKEFKVCFTIADYESNWNPETLEQKIKEKQKNPAATKKLITKRIKQNKRDLKSSNVLLSIAIAMALGLTAFPILKFISIATNIPFLELIPVIIWLTIVTLTYKRTISDIQYYQSLYKEIDQK